MGGGGGGQVVHVTTTGNGGSARQPSAGRGTSLCEFRGRSRGEALRLPRSVPMQQHTPGVQFPDLKTALGILQDVDKAVLCPLDDACGRLYTYSG